MRLVLPASILLAAIVVALTMALTSHWSIAPVGGGRQGAYRLNRWTGDVIWCFHSTGQAPDRLQCKTDDEWVDVPNSK